VALRPAREGLAGRRFEVEGGAACGVDLEAGPAVDQPLDEEAGLRQSLYLLEEEGPDRRVGRLAGLASESCEIRQEGRR